MQFTKDTHVYSSENQDVGRIERMVINPVNQKVSHVVVRQGLFFTEDKVIPVEYFDQATPERATLRPNIGNLNNLPKFEEVQHVPVEYSDMEDFPHEPVDGPFYMYWNPPMGATTFHATGFTAGMPMALPEASLERRYYVKRTTQNIPDDSIALDDGAHVHSSDGQHVGDIEQIYVDPETNYATHILISQGFLLKENKWLPTLWFSTVSEANVYLAVPASTIEDLPAVEMA